MNWITTNLRLPEDMYKDLKMQAAKERESIDVLIQKKIQASDLKKTQRSKKMLKDLEAFSKKVTAKTPGLNLTKAVIDARYTK